MSILQLCEESESEYEGEKMGLDLIQLRLNKKKNGVPRQICPWPRPTTRKIRLNIALICTLNEVKDDIC